MVPALGSSQGFNSTDLNSHSTTAGNRQQPQPQGQQQQQLQAQQQFAPVQPQGQQQQQTQQPQAPVNQSQQQAPYAPGAQPYQLSQQQQQLADEFRRQIAADGPQAISRILRQFGNYEAELALVSVLDSGFLEKFRCDTLNCIAWVFECLHDLGLKKQLNEALAGSLIRDGLIRKCLENFDYDSLNRIMSSIKCLQNATY